MHRRKTNSSPVIVTRKTADECPAKTWCSEGKVLLGRTVYEHCAIVGSIAKALIEQFPPALRSMFPKGSELLAACHDVGKLSLTFYARLLLAASTNVKEAEDLCHEAKIECNNLSLSNKEKMWGGHAGASFLTLMEMTKREDIAWVAGSHHGDCPKVATTTPSSFAKSPSLGGAVWQEERENLIHQLEKLFNSSFPSKLHSYESWLDAGLTTVADWIGSGDIFNKPEEPWQPLVNKSLERAGFKELELRNGLSFGDIFQTSQGVPYAPSPVQKGLAQAVKNPGVYVLEAPMGAGKTEAAFFAAYQALQSGLARGVYFALPTQITANKIYERFAIFLSKISCSKMAPGLLHGKAEEFLDSLRVSVTETSPGKSWFSYRKRGLLSPFAVGTVDQMLLAIMAVRHNAVRVFGLAGKVIIIDEVHSYDAYTNYLLLQLLELLKKLHCVVIVLSATLTKDARNRLLGGDVETLSSTQLSYRLEGKEVQNFSFDTEETKEVLLQIQDGDEAEKKAIDEAIGRAETGQQVLWVENDVKTSQKIYRVLAARSKDLGIECGLLHSRFTVEDRFGIENHWVPLYGKGDCRAREKRGRILVGTQILEQSLDIDADFLVTRLAVTDMVLQRVGRLWRHKETVRPSGAKREVWILSPSLKEALAKPRIAFGTTACVYAPYFLYRTLEVFSKKKALSLPKDIPVLLEETYKERNETSEPLVSLKEEFINGNPSLHIPGVEEMKRKAHTQLASLIPGIEGDDDTVSTRYMQRESAEVLLLKRIIFDDAKKLTRLVLADDQEIALSWNAKVDEMDLREKARKVALNQVRVQIDHAKEFRADANDARKGFSRVLWTGYENKNLFVAVIQPDGTLETLSGERKPFCYSSNIGWEKKSDERL